MQYSLQSILIQNTLGCEKMQLCAGDLLTHGPVHTCPDTQTRASKARQG